MKHFASLTALAMAATFSVAVVQADQWDKETKITIDHPMHLPRVTLQPGSYVIKLADPGNGSDRHIVQVFNKDKTHIIATILAIPNERLTPTGKSVFAFWETPAGQPQALRAWFYPGDNFGQEFLYPKREADQISQTVKQPVPTSEDVAPAAPAPATTASAPAPASPLVAQAATPPPAPKRYTAPVETAQNTPPPAPVASPAPTPTPSQVPDSLPRTASDMPLIGLIGLLSLAAFAGLRAILAS